MVIKGKTIRWFNIPEHIKKLTKNRKSWIHPWKQINPYWFRHDIKEIRIELHRKYRHLNRIRLRKGMDILIEPKTNGWMSH